MRLERLSLKGFRNHDNTTLECSGGTNIILGENGQGKTNILEAISYLCLTKSFTVSGDAAVLGFGRNAFEVQGTFLTDAGVQHEARLVYVLETKEKVYTLDKRRVEPLSSVISRFPVAILSPEHAAITSGPPLERRKFVNLLLSQANAAYAEDLYEYRRVHQQRNKILSDARINKADPRAQLEPWDEQLALVGARIMSRRRMFVDEFQAPLQSAYGLIADEAEKPAMAYVPSCDVNTARNEQELRETLLQELRRRYREELRLGVTVVGPHRDEFLCTINRNDVRLYASQGQHKTFLIALKLAEYFYLKERRHEDPIVLLDDVFSELDVRRTKRVLEWLNELNQTFITSTTPHIFESMLLNSNHRGFYVSRGSVVQTEGMPSV